jgi:hypothetical protein
MFMFDWSARLTPQKATLYSYPIDVSLKFQQSLSAVTLGIHLGGQIL